MALSGRPKLAIIVSHPIQHFSPVYRLLSANAVIDVVVIYLSDAGAKAHFDRDFNIRYQWDIDLLEGYRSVTLCPGSEITGTGLFGLRGPGIERVLNSEQPDALLLYGYDGIYLWRAIHWARRRRRKLLFVSDSILSGFRRSWWRVLLKSLPVGWLFRRIDLFLATGDRNVEYLLAYGAESSRVRRCPLSIDLSRFHVPAGSDRVSLARDMRERYGLRQDAFIVLFSGKLVPRKRPQDLLRAVLSLRDRHSIQAVFVGSGDLQTELEAEVRAAGATDVVRLLGFVNQSEMPALQYAADAFVMCSEKDAHPLVVTEAAACGLPIICSANVGCVGPTDTARANVNALIFPAGDVQALADAILRLALDHELRARLGGASIEIAEGQDIRVAAKATEAAVLELVCERGR